MRAPRTSHRSSCEHPHRSTRTAGQFVWETDEQFDIDHHFRHSALPKPGRIRELLELSSRLHSTRLAWDRPLWESHVIEGLADGRVAMYTKMHHALVDGVSAMRLLAAIHSPDPDERDMPAPWGKRTRPAKAAAAQATESTWPTCRCRRCVRRWASPPRPRACPPR